MNVCQVCDDLRTAEQCPNIDHTPVDWQAEAPGAWEAHLKALKGEIDGRS